MTFIELEMWLILNGVIAQYERHYVIDFDVPYACTVTLCFNSFFILLKERRKTLHVVVYDVPSLYI